MGQDSKENIGTDQIVIHHIGGLWDCGNAEKLEILKPRWYIYDADGSNLEKTKRYKHCEFINKCLGDHNGEIDFHEFENSSANSIYPCDPRANDFIWKQGHIIGWGKWCTIKNKLKIPVVTFDSLNLPIDVLSMDAQGSEWHIMHGISNWDDILAVFTEVEFQSLYKGQKLFGDMFNFLTEKGFRMMELGKIGIFNDNAMDAEGFCTFAEPIFLKDYIYVNDKVKLEKLAKIADCFKRYDFVRKAREKIENLS
jgi:hypothetical protein